MTDGRYRALSDLGANGPPTNRSQLDERVRQIATLLGQPERRTRVTMAALIVAQMLPEGVVVKGGMGIKLRLGESGTRTTSDLDVAAADRDNLIESLRDSLSTGWGVIPPSKKALKRDPQAVGMVAFTGFITSQQPAEPVSIPPNYIMQPYRVSLEFLGKSPKWAALDLEVAPNELGVVDHPMTLNALPPDLGAMIRALGVGTIDQIAIISLEYQITQKLHALTAPGSERVRDLVDLQLLWHAGTVDGAGLDLGELKRLCRRTWAYRRAHPWPPSVPSYAAHDAGYQSALTEVNLGEGHSPVVRGSLAKSREDAEGWLQARIDEIDRT